MPVIRWALIIVLCIPVWSQSNALRPNIVQSFLNNSVDTISFQDVITSGNLLVVCEEWQNVGATWGTPTDTVGTSFTTVTVFVFGSLFMQCAYGAANGSGADTVTTSGLTGHQRTLLIAEFKNVSSVLDVSVSFNASGSSTATITPTTTVNGDLLVVFAGSFETTFQFYGSSPQNLATGTSGDFGAPLMSYENLGLAGMQTYTQLVNTTSGPPPFWAIYGLAFKPNTIAITTDILPHGARGSAYKATLTAIGGAGAYTFAATGLPVWASLNTSTGEITGTPTFSGCTMTGITVTDGTLTSASQPLNLCAGNSFAAVTAVQNKTAASGHSVTFDNPVAKGDVLLVLGWGPFSVVDTYVLSDTASGKFTDTLGTVFQRVYPITQVDGIAPATVYMGCTTAAGTDTITSANPPAYAVGASEWTKTQLVIDDATNLATAGYPGTSISQTTGNYIAQVDNELLFTSFVASDTWTSGVTLTMDAPFTTLWSGQMSGFNVVGGQGYRQVTTAGTYTASATMSRPGGLFNQAMAMQLIGLRPEITGLGCDESPTASASRHKVVLM